MSNNRPLYNVNEYTDAELYDILDLVNPSDRELEAKILMQIHKYENIGTKSAQKLANFFDDIYNHFFETEEHEDAVEGYANQGETFEEYIGDASKKYQLKPDNGPTESRRVNRADRATIEANIASSAEAPDPTKNKSSSATGNMMSMGEKSEPETQTVGYTRSLEYSKGKLNPILQQTTKRIISIDSQYRSDKRTMSTAFTFNLSEPLKDVVSLKLYSVQIPYTWYTIGKAYGNNFFYFKGRTEGLNSDSSIHDIQVSIAPGNYSPAELIGAVNNSVFAIKNSVTDISLGNTAFSYNYNTSLSTARIDLKKGYNQSSYNLQFDTNTIPDYLGFIDRDYSTRTLRSRLNDETYNINTPFILTENNNYFKINIYQDDSNVVNSSIDMVVDPGTYTRRELITEVKTILSANDRLTNTNCNLSANNKYIDLTLQLSRNTNRIDGNTKTQVVFYEQQHYSVDFTNTIFSNSIQNLSGKIGYDISRNFTLTLHEPITTIAPITIIKDQLLCTITTLFSNDTTPVVHEIVSTYDEVTFDNNIDVYRLLHGMITTYTYNNVKIFGNTTVDDNGNLTLVIKKDDRIWTNDTDANGNILIESCFGLDAAINNLNEITSETPAQEQSGRYTISTEPYVHFTPNISYFRDGLNGINDISFSVPQSIATGNYNLGEYLSAINQSIRTYSKEHNNIFNVPDDDSYVFNHTTAYPEGTYAYLQNNIFQLNVELNKVFDRTMYKIDFESGIFDTQTQQTYMRDISNNVFTTNILGDLTTEFECIVNTNNNIAITKDTVIFKLNPKQNNPAVNGNENDQTLELTLGSIPDEYRVRSPLLDPNIPTEYVNDLTSGATDNRQINDIVHFYIQPVFDNYADPISNVKIFNGSTITASISGGGYAITLNLVVNKKLVAKNYCISFKDTSVSANTWNANLKISNLLLNGSCIDTTFEMNATTPYTIYDTLANPYKIDDSKIDSIGNILDKEGVILGTNGMIEDVSGVTHQLNGRVIYTVIPDGTNVVISGTETFPTLVPLLITSLNNTLRFAAIEDGVATSTELNDVILTIPPGEYYRDTLIREINAQLNNASVRTNISATNISIVNKYGNYYTKFVINLKREYGTTDYNLVFYDKASFATCTSGGSSVQNTTWDTTIGWIMGFREYTVYDMSASGTEEDTVVDSMSGNIATIIGDTGLSTNLYNYFLLCLDDFNQNHLNDGLVTITNVDTSIPLPSYASRADFVCDPATGQKVYNITTGLTEKQIYAAEAIANSSATTESIGSSVSTKSYGTGPFVSDVFGLIPMKVSGLANGSSYVEFGGTLQNQERSYFGPVNIHRMSVRLVTDRGNLVDLNKANWSFSLICEQLNKLDPSSGNK